MSMPSVRLAQGLAVASLALFVADTALVAESIGLFSARSVGIHGWPLVNVAAAGCAVLGAVIVGADRRQPIGWLLTITGVVTCVSMVCESYTRWALFEGGPGPTRLAELVGWLSAVSGGSFALAGLAVTFLLVPNGGLMARGWRWVAVMAVLGYVAYVAGVVRVGPHDISTRESDTTQGDVVAATLFAVGILAILGALLASVVCLGIRLHRARGQERRQVRIVALGAASVGIALVTVIVTEAFNGGNQSVWSSLVLYVSYAFLLACVAVAVLRYRLYDVELIVSRALLVAVAGGFAALGYVGLVVALGRAAGEGTGGFWASLVAMTAVALAFQPLRRAVVRLADRLAYGARAAPYDALATFSRRIGRSPAPGALLPAIAAAAAQTVAAERAVVRLDVGNGPDLVEVWPTGSPDFPEQPGLVIPIADATGPLGSIALSLAAGRDVRPFEQRMLSDIAEQAAIAFRNVRLHVELAVQVDQLDERTRALAASRRRVIDAADAERRRLEGALAREVLPAMAALRGDLIEADDNPDEPTVAGYVARATDALEGLRELTRGIYPTLLNRSGLAAALTAFADRRGLNGRVSVDDDVAASRYSDRVEAAAYFCCLEALAHATPAASITVEQAGDRLLVSIRGSHVEGQDRLGMWDRVEAADGRLAETGDLLTIDLPAVSAESPPPARRPAGARG